MTTYRLFWISDVGFAGMSDLDFPTPEAAMSEATRGVTWTREGREYRSNRSVYGDVFIVKPSR